MSETLLPAISALRDAEIRLREAAAKAAAAGAYDNLVVITRLAKTVQAMLAEVDGANNPGLPSKGPLNNTAEPAVIHRDISVSKTRKISIGDPVFSRDADLLVKRARSRKTREEYEHRAPADVIFVVAECLSEWRSAKKLLTADQLLDMYTKRKGSVASYQVYVVLGWLAQIKLVRRHDRSGYSVPSPSTIIQDAQKAWTELGTSQNK